MKIKNIIVYVKILSVYLKAGIARWFGPRNYVIAYSYKDKSNELHIDAKMVKAIVPSARDVMAVIQRDIGSEGSELRILSFTEAPACLFNGVCIDAAEKLVEKADTIAQEIKDKHDTKVVAEPVEDDEDEDVSDMFR